MRAEVLWRLLGLSESGLYPTVPREGTRYAVLAPAFALTARAAQGQTMSQGAIVDSRIPKDSNPMCSYVAITRVQRFSDLLIHRPLLLEAFQQGVDVLLALLRGENMDWAALEADYALRRPCNGCILVQY